MGRSRFWRNIEIVLVDAFDLAALGECPASGSVLRVWAWLHICRRESVGRLKISCLTPHATCHSLAPLHVTYASPANPNDPPTSATPIVSTLDSYLSPPPPTFANTLSTGRSRIIPHLHLNVWPHHPPHHNSPCASCNYHMS